MLPRTLEILADLIAFQTVSADSNLAMIDYIADHLQATGARTIVTRDASETKANLFATIGPDAPGGIVLSGHTDVVPVADQDWTSDPFAMEMRGDLIFGRGACDMKGFIAATLALVERLPANALSQPLHLAFTYDEETGCLGARQLVDELKARNIHPDVAIIGEPTSMRIIEGHKGCYEYTTRFAGLEGHGSAPDAGVNAAEYATLYVSRLLELREALKARAPAKSPFDPPWTTINIGRVAGGVAHNVIAGKAEVEWEMRPVQPSDATFVKADLTRYVDERLLPQMHTVHAGSTITTETIAEVAGLVPMEQNAARDLVAELTGANAADVVAFGTEAGIFQELGTDVVVCGPGSIEQAHKPNEFVSREQLGLCCDMLQALGARLSV